MNTVLQQFCSVGVLPALNIAPLSPLSAMRSNYCVFQPVLIDPIMTVKDTVIGAIIDRFCVIVPYLSERIYRQRNVFVRSDRDRSPGYYTFTVTPSRVRLNRLFRPGRRFSGSRPRRPAWAPQGGLSQRAPDLKKNKPRLPRDFFGVFISFDGHVDPTGFSPLADVREQPVVMKSTPPPAELGDEPENPPAPAATKTNLKGDWMNIFLLLLLYTMQGLPLGFSAAVVILLKNNKSITYNDMVNRSAGPVLLSRPRTYAIGCCAICIDRRLSVEENRETRSNARN